ncbi:MAG: VWA domain-containing protein [Phycisphaerae bacterium]|nr:VWA domain-containing protein [Phycisphaerae bacterium]
MIEYAHPQAFLLLLLLPVFWWWWSRRAGHAVIRFPNVAALREAGGRGRWRVVLRILRTAALATLIVALARPQKADVAHAIYAEGIAIQMVLDTSSSMAAGDMTPIGNRPVTRLDVVKEVFKRFVGGDDKDDKLGGRPNDLIGMIRFARYADSICPLTLDHDSLLKIVDATEIVGQRSEDGTAIGDALALAVERLKDLKRTAGSGEQHVITSRIVILLTDGEDNASTIAPEQAADLAQSLGIRVYTIMAGSGQGIGFLRVAPDDRLLRKIADVTGGQYFRAQTPESLAKIYDEIDKLERTRTEERRYVMREERSQPWLLAAFACLALQTVLAATWLRKIP